MLQFGSDILPQGTLAYVAFRSAFVSTMRDYATAVEDPEDEELPIGYLMEVPFLENVAPQVQIDLLADTWSRHSSHQLYDGNLIDEAVVYSCCEFAASELETHPGSFAAYLQNGPRGIGVNLDGILSAELRSLHIKLTGEGNFLMLSQFEDMDPIEATAMMKTFKMDRAANQCLYDLLGRWHVEPRLIERLTGLLTKEETARFAKCLPSLWNCG